MDLYRLLGLNGWELLMRLSIYGTISKFFKGIDRRFRIMLAAIGLYSWTSNLPMQYNQLYVTALGANTVELGSLNGIGGTINSIISLPVGWFIDKYGVKKVIIIGLVISAAIATIYSLAFNWWMIIPAMVLAPISMNFIMPLTDMIFVETTKPQERALAMGFSRTVWAIPTAFAPMTAAVIVAVFGGINVQGIRPIYFVQLVSTGLIILFIMLLLGPSHARLAADRSNLTSRRSLTKDLKELFKGEKWLKHWAILMSLQQIGWSIASPFIPLWMVNVKGADPYILGIIGTAGQLTSALLQIPMGRLADKIGRKKTFLLLTPFSYLGTILLILAPSPDLLIGVGILGVSGAMMMGGIGGVSFIPYITMYWETVPAEKMGRWFGFTGIFAVMALPASILGGLMWQSGLTELVLLMPVLLEALITIPILTRIPDTLVKNKQ